MRQVEVGIHLERFFELFDRIVVVTLEKKKQSDQRTVARRGRLQCLRLANLDQSFVEVAHVSEVMTVPLLGRREVRAELYRPLQRLFGPRPVEFVLILYVAQRCVCLAEIRIELKCLVNRVTSDRKGFVRGHDAENTKQGVTFGETDIGAREARVTRYRLFEILDRATHACFVSAKIKTAIGVELVCLGIARVMDKRGVRLADQLWRQGVLHTCSDRVLHREVCSVKASSKLAPTVAGCRWCRAGAQTPEGGRRLAGCALRARPRPRVAVPPRPHRYRGRQTDARSSAGSPEAGRRYSDPRSTSPSCRVRATRCGRMS